MPFACVKLVLASTVLNLCVAIRKKRPSVWDVQRSDDAAILSEEQALAVTNVTENGCACTSECKLDFLHDCNAGRWCTVGDECTEYRRRLFGERFDYCLFRDPLVGLASARERFESLLWSLKVDSTPGPYYGGIDVALGVRGESIIDTMTMETDLFAYTRTKWVRPVGVVAPIRFVSKGQHGYTGIFRGNDLGIVRLSLSLTPNEDNGFAPGVAMKFYREGRPSANFMGFTSFVGQNCSDKNFFQYNMYTNVPPAAGLSALVPKKFKQATGCTQMVGLSDAADDFDGQTPVFPFDVAFAGVPYVEFSCGDEGAAGWANLGKLPKGTKLFTLKAKNAPGGAYEAIGDIILEDSLTTSRYGDEHLFFRHQRMEEDFAIHPEWLDMIDKKNECGTSDPSTVAPDPAKGCITIL